MEYAEDKEKRITQLRKGILELAVMGILYRQRHYGYSLIRVLNEGASLSLKEGTIYPILSRLSRDGLVSSEWVESDQGPPRKYYELTSHGRQLYTDLSHELDLLTSLVKTNWASPEQPDEIGRPLLVRRR
jgi:PadR family transcriptional regulator PadR